MTPAKQRPQLWPCTMVWPCTAPTRSQHAKGQSSQPYWGCLGVALTGPPLRVLLAASMPLLRCPVLKSLHSLHQHSALYSVALLRLPFAQIALQWSISYHHSAVLTQLSSLSRPHPASLTQPPALSCQQSSLSHPHSAVLNSSL